MYKKWIIVLPLLLILHTNAQQAIADSICNATLLKHYVSALANDSMEGRFSGNKGNTLAAQFIVSEFKAIGLRKIVGLEEYYQPVVVDNTFYGNNVVGIIEGKDSIKRNKLIIFSAHYDHIGIKGKGIYQKDASKEDTIYNGANDNASGVAGILALARFYRAIEQND